MRTVKHFTQAKDPVSISATVSHPSETVKLHGKDIAEAHSLSNFVDVERDQIGVGKKSKKRTGKRATSPWIAHVKATQAKHGCSYKQAMSLASATYKRL